MTFWPEVHDGQNELYPKEVRCLFFQDELELESYINHPQGWKRSQLLVILPLKQENEHDNKNTLTLLRQLKLMSKPQRWRLGMGVNLEGLVYVIRPSFPFFLFLSSVVSQAIALLSAAFQFIALVFTLAFQMQTKVPTIDDQNPLWCPAINAAAYINSVRRRNRSNIVIHRKNRGYLKSFLYTLEKALILDADHTSDDDATSKRFFLPIAKKRRRPRRKTRPGGLQSSSSPASNEELVNFSCSLPVWEQDEDSISPMPSGEPWLRTMRESMQDWCLPHGLPSPLDTKERLPSSFSDMDGLTGHELSRAVNQDTSFDVTLQHETLFFLPAGIFSSPHAKDVKGIIKKGPKARIQELEDQLYGPAIGTQSPLGIKYFVTQLDSLLPGVRLKERLYELGEVSHDSIGRFLACNGYLNARVLGFLRSSEVGRLSMTESLRDANGLNICRSDTMAVFSKPNSFHHLSELTFTNCRISESDFVHINRLPSLSALLLNNTAISNEVVFLLLPLKGTLSQLSLASNPLIDDDAVPALLMLSKLSYLSILDTGIGMPGLRRLAKIISTERRVIDIEIPSVCEDYISDLSTKYAIDIRPPLIAEASVCQFLSIAALKRNLEAHAAVNKNISVVGTKAEMMERLKALLEVRALDMRVRDMILGPGEEDETW